MATFDLLIRASAITVMLLSALLLLRDARHIKPARWGIALGMFSIVVILLELPSSYEWPVWIRAIGIGFFGANSTLVCWWFSRSLFQDDFHYTRLDFFVAGVWLLLSLPFLVPMLQGAQDINPPTNYVRTFIAFGLVAHMVFVALDGRRDDLLENRRKVRLWFVVAIAVIMLSTMSVEMLYGYQDEPNLLKLYKAGSYLVMGVWGIFWIAEIRDNVFSFESPENLVPAAKPDINPKDQLLLNKLNQTMEAEEAYLQSGLTIGGLAGKLKVPEHQLRNLINSNMGHRNFSAYLNQYRIKAAKEALSDPDKINLPVLTIAMDVGYNSLAPFNRAFRAEVGETPTQFRQKSFTPDNISEIVAE